jgi:hypothetical protein
VQDRSQVVTVEFLGIPGTGKSWLNQRMLERLRQCSTEVALDKSQAWAVRFDATGKPGWWRSAKASSRKLVFQLATLWRQHQLLCFALPRLARDVGSARLKWRSARQLLSALMVAHVPDRWRGSPCVVGLDENLLQRSDKLFTRHDHPVDRVEIHQFVQYLPKSDIVVWLTSANDVAIARARARARGLPQRLRHMTESDVLNHVAQLHEVFRCCIDHIEKECRDVVVLTVDTTDRQHVAAFCESMLIPTVCATLRRKLQMGERVSLHP